MNRSDSISKLAAALVKANAEVQHATKDSQNPHFRSSYASLQAVLDTIKPVYAAHGLTVTQVPGYEGDICTLDTMVLHESGEWISGTSGSPIQKHDPQGVGSAVTYLRRYSLASLAGIGQEDDDGIAASTPKPKAEKPKRASAEAESLAREVKELLARGNGTLPEKGVTAAQEAIDAKDPARLRAAIAWLNDNLAVPA